jgi:hypothetical protein
MEAPTAISAALIHNLVHNRTVLVNKSAVEIWNYPQ